MSNIKVTVQDANNVLLEVTPVPIQQIAISRGVAGRGITDVTAVEIDNALYLEFTFSDGTTEIVGPVGTIQYIGESPIVVDAATISLSTVPVTLGGTGQTTANAGFNALAPTQTGNAGKYLTTDGSNTSWANNPLGTVTSVDMTVPTGLTVSGNPITTSGTLAVALQSGYSIPTTASQTNWDTAYSERQQWNGGATNLVAATGRTSLGLGTIATQDASAVAITGGSITGITDLAIADGGTGASTASGARSNLGLGTAAVLNAGVALGVATLDAGGTVPLSQIPASIQGGVSYQGAWNASTNTPTLVSSVGSKGFYYVVSVAGNTNLNGVTDWLVGDWAIYNGTAWEKIDNTDQVASVNGYTGVVVLSNTDVGAPPTSLTISAGTGLTGGGSLAANRTLSIANTTVTAAPYGTASAVPTFTVNGQGQLTAASDVTIAIANTQVSGLGTMSTQNANSVAITGGSITGITDLAIADGGTGASTAGGALTNLGAIGTITSTDGSIVVTPSGTTVNLAVSEASPASTLLTQVRNTTGATLTKGTVVYISGATGQIATVSKAIATGDATSAQTLGMITSNLANNTNGYVTVFGLLENMDTSAYTDGAQLYLSGTVAGEVTATKPSAPIHLVYVAVVEYAHPTQGKLLVKVQNGYELDEIHDVSIVTPVTGQTLVYNSATDLWVNNTVSLTAGVNGTLPILNGGTGQTTANAAFNALAPSQTGNSGKYLTTDGTDTSWASNPLGTVTSVAASVPSFLSIAGSPITTSGTLAISLSGTALPTTSGGTGLTSFTANGVVYASSSSALTTGSALTFDGVTLVNDTGSTGGTTGFSASNSVALGYTALTLRNTGASGKTYEVGMGGNGTSGNYQNNFYIRDTTGNPLLYLNSASTFVANAFNNVRAAGSDTYINHLTTGINNTVMGFNNSGSTNGSGVLNNTAYIGSLNTYSTSVVGNGATIATFVSSAQGAQGISVNGVVNITQTGYFPTTGFTHNTNGYLYALGGTSGFITQVSAVNVTTTTASGFAVTGTLSSTLDATIYGLTVGRGAGAGSTNTAVGASALAANTTGSGTTAFGYQALNLNTTGTGTAFGYVALAKATTADGNTAFGSLSLYNTTTGSYNVAVGLQALQNNTTASNNTAVGYQAGYANTTGSPITAIGTQALNGNTTGSYNVGVGWQVLSANTTGNFNVAVGDRALVSNTTASNNTAVGYQAGYNNNTGTITAFGYKAGFGQTIGTLNTFLGSEQGSFNTVTGASNSGVGHRALLKISSGSYNTAIGQEALRENTTASFNTAVGYQAGYYNTTGLYQTFVGAYAGTATTTGEGNSAFGVQSLEENTTGGFNTAIGRFALKANTTASNNTAVGYQAAYANTTGSDNTAVGFQTFQNNTTGSNNAAFGLYALLSNTTGGTNTAIGRSALQSNTTASGNTAVGYQAGYNNTTDGFNTYLGYQTGYSNDTGAYNTFIGQGAGYYFNPASSVNGFNTFIGQASGDQVTTGTKNTILGRYNGNQGGLDIRTLSNYLVLSDGDGNPRIYHNGTTVVIPSLPTSSAGLPSGGLYVVAGALMVA